MLSLLLFINNCRPFFMAIIVALNIKNMKSIYFVSLLFLLTGCGIQYYSVNMHNAPLLKEKGDIKINGAASVSEESGNALAIETQAAYAFNKHWGIVGDFHSIQKQNSNSALANYGTSYTIGLGYFTPIQNTKLMTEIYGSIGMGNAIFTNSETHYYKTFNNGQYQYFVGDYYQKHDFSSMSLQTNIGCKAKYFECALTGKLAKLTYYKREVKVGGLNANYTFDDHDPFNKSFILLEPGIMLRGGSENIKVQSAFSIGFGANNLIAQRINFSLGLQVSLNTFGKNKK